MKREVRRELRLPAFALLRGDLELLWRRMCELFDGPEQLRTSINLSLPAEKLQFESVTELQEYKGLRGRVTDFSLKITQRDRSITVKTGGLFSTVPTLIVEAESDVWCAGAVEAVLSVIRSNRVWYSWFIRAPLLLIFFLLSVAPALVQWLLPKVPTMPPALALSWASVVVVLGYLSFSKDKLLPAASLVFTSDLGFIRRYGSELGLALGVISLLLAIYTWLYPNGT